MPIDRKFLGYTLPAFTVTVTPERLANFCEAIGEPAPAEGERLAPLTFMKVLEGEDNSSRRILEALGVELKRVLHAEQQFDYFAPIRAGDAVRVERKVADLYDKKGGLLDFIVIETSFTAPSGALLGKSRQIVLVRNPAKES